MSQDKSKHKLQRRILTDASIRALSLGETATESLPGRGTGSILFERRPSGSIDCYFRMRKNGKASKFKLGTYRSTARSSGLSLVEIRHKARELSRIAIEHGDIKQYLAEQAEVKEKARLERERALEEARRRAELEASRGTLSELFNDYIDSRRGKNGERYIRELERVLKVELEGNALTIVRMKARDVRPDHIREILQPIWDRGAKSMADKIRSYLHAAFEYGLKHEYSLERKSSRGYSLEINPVAATPKEHKGKAITRALNEDNIALFWNTITELESVGPIVARLLLFVISTGGQRIEQVLREPWKSYNFREKILTIDERKGKGNNHAHLVPLTGRAIRLLEEVYSINPSSPWPWSTTGTGPIEISTPGGAVKKWLESPFSKNGETQVDYFTPRDFRRTCSQIMQREKIETEACNLLQSHGLTGVVAKHYQNDPWSYLPRNRDTMKRFDIALDRILFGKKKSHNNLVPFPESSAR